MVNIRSINEIILGLIDYYRLVQPDLDTKPGTVARDVFIDAPASQIALIYDELSGISNLQSIRLSSGADLDKIASNFGLTRKDGAVATGTALLTFNDISAPIGVNSGSYVIASNGMAFSVINGVSLVPSSANYYRSVATKFKNDLNFVGITDQYAVQVLVTAVSAGTMGNINKYSLTRANISGISGVTNTATFTGGTDQETDAVFRNRILSVFNGSSIGTTLGYQNTAFATTGVVDALVIGPGDTLMTRDGTVTKKNSDGSYTIISEGQGGKVDIIILGQNLIDTTDSYIYRDKSNTNDPTNEKNNFVLGQISGDENKTINRRRIDNIANATLPSQPVNSITQVTGSLSGPNFKPKTVDSFGRIFGNYELIKDTGLYSGSPWGSDTLKWISNKISLFREDFTKGQYNGQDTLTYSDVLDIPSLQQNIAITNENSLVSSDRSIIQLLHYPVTNVTRVYNVNTGERYLITNQNIDGTGSTNYTGRIKISGNTLPSPSDVLQVDYNWVFNYDPYVDYDGKLLNDNIRPSTDVIDWGYCSKVKNEKILFTKDVTSNIFNGTLSHPISSIVSCNVFSQVDGQVVSISSGTYVGRLAVQLSTLTQSVNTIENIYLKNTYLEVYNTAQNDGLFTTSVSIVGTSTVHNCYIILPSDTQATVNDYVTVVYNSNDVYSLSDSNGSFNFNNITIPVSNVETYVSGTSQIYLNVNYIANIQTLFNGGVSSLPISRSANGFVFNNNGFINNYISNNLKRENYLVKQNPSSFEYYLELNITNNNYIMTANDVIAVIRLSDGKVLWDISNIGTLSYGPTNNYWVQLTGYNNPQLNDQVLILYYAKNNNAYQPFSFADYNIKNNIDTISLTPTSQFVTNIINFVDNVYPLKFEVIDPATQYVYAYSNDGYIVQDPLNSKQATISSSTLVNFNTILGITNFKIRVTDGYNFNNNGIYDIISYDSISKTFVISLLLDNLSNSQISVVRVSDNKELWNNNCTFDYENNKLIFESSTNPLVGDQVFVLLYNYNNLRKSPTKLLLNTVDQNKNIGNITVSGSTIHKIDNVVFTATNTGLKLNLIEAVQKALNTTNVNNYQLVRLVSLEKVQTAGNSNDEVLSTLVTYDVLLSKLKDNSYYLSESVLDTTLGNFDFILPYTYNNNLNTIDSPNLPKLGDKLRVTCYVVNKNDSENLNYTSNGILYTNKKFALIDRIYVSSGFQNSLSTTLNVNTMNQPLSGARYTSFYDYTAPKTNERIVVDYQFNRLISDVTFNIENNRPINADVIVKQAVAIYIDVTMNIVLTTAYTTLGTTVVENVRDKIIASINLNTLGSTIDSSDLVNAAYGVAGVDRSRILYFNRTGELGQLLSITAQKNEYFVANNVIVNIESR